MHRYPPVVATCSVTSERWRTGLHIPCQSRSGAWKRAMPSQHPPQGRASPVRGSERLRSPENSCLT